MSSEYTDFLSALGVLAKIVAVSLALERAMAWVFENELVRFLLTKTDQSAPASDGTPARTSRFPGLKSFIVFAVAATICFKYNLNAFFSLLHTGNTYSVDDLGIWLTAGVVSGGSAGAIALFQGVLNLNKDVRDAQTAAKIAQAQAAKDIAQAQAGEATARQQAAEHAAAEAKAKRDTAEATAGAAGKLVANTVNKVV